MAVTSICTRTSGRRLRKPLLSLGSLKRSFTGPVACGRVVVAIALPFLALPLGGAVASVAAKLSGTSARPMATVMVEVGPAVSALGSLAGSKLRWAVSHVAASSSLGSAMPSHRVLARAAVDHVALAVGDRGHRVVGAACLRARRSRVRA